MTRTVDFLTYRKTRDALQGALPLRLSVVVVVAAIMGVYVSMPIAMIWAALICALLIVEMLLFRRWLHEKQEALKGGVKTVAAILALTISTLFTLPVWVCLSFEDPAFYFAAALMMAGALVNLTIHNGQSRLIFFTAVTPIMATFAVSSFLISVDAMNALPALSAIVFLGSLIMSFEGKRKNIREIVEAMALAMEEREAAARADRAKARFLANMSHEVRTPLNGILGMAQALQDEIDAPRAVAKIGTIKDCGETLLRLLNDILDHARAEAGAMTLEVGPSDLRVLLNQTVNHYRDLAQQKGLALHLNTDGLLVAGIDVDAPRLQQCLGNILSNAVKFTERGAILIKASAHKDAVDSQLVHVEISISDTGLGISAEHLDKIFGAFEQADNKIARHFGGAGLGLAIARDIMEAFGGKVSAVSTPGIGSTFILQFPVKQTALGAPAAQVDADLPTTRRGLSILIAEDNAVNFQVACALLDPLHPDVTHAVNGAEALTFVRQRPFDLILLDMQMPVVDGLEVIRQIRGGSSAYARTPIIAMTAESAVGEEKTYIDAGANAFLTKPLRAETLKAAVMNWAQGARSDEQPSEGVGPGEIRDNADGPEKDSHFNSLFKSGAA